MRLVLAKIKRLFTRGISSLFNARFLKGFGWAVFVSAVVIGSLSVFDPVYAQVGSFAGDAADFVVTGITKLLLVTARLAIALTVFFLRFFITLASYNNYINTPVVQVGWIMVRDVANMFFVIALLVIAFGTILGIEQYEWKKGLVKLVLAAILINFSNLLAQLVIDAAHVFTITFLNAIAATAGGNLIEMFKLTSILGFVQKPPSGDVSNVRLELLGGAMMAAFFAVWAAIAMGAYVIVMMARVVLLWVLIIMSPLAFIWKVLPATEGYAQKWGKEFKEQVLVAPIMVFFMWLTFATLGNGQIINSIQKGDGDASSVIPLQVEGTDEIAISISKVSTWENMASFLIALAFLFIGIKEVGESGAVGSKLIGNAVNFGKKVATIASGVATAQWLGGQARDKGTSLVKGSAWHMPIVGGKQIARKWEDTKNAAKEGFYMSAATPKNELKGLNRLVGFAARRTVKKTKHSGKTKSAAEDAEKLAFKRTSTSSGSSIAGQLRDDHFDGFKGKNYDDTKGLISNIAKGNVNFGGTIGETLSKWGMLPAAILGSMSARTSEIAGLGRKTGQGWDRKVEGMLEAEGVRKAAKDKQLISKQKQITLSEKRIRNGKREDDNPTLAEEVVSREEKAAATGDKERKMFDTIKKESVKKGQKQIDAAMDKIEKAKVQLIPPKEKKLKGELKVVQDELAKAETGIETAQRSDLAALDELKSDKADEEGNVGAYNTSKEEAEIERLQTERDGILSLYDNEKRENYEAAASASDQADQGLANAKAIVESGGLEERQKNVADVEATLKTLNEELELIKSSDVLDEEDKKKDAEAKTKEIEATQAKLETANVALQEADVDAHQQKVTEAKDAQQKLRVEYNLDGLDEVEAALDVQKESKNTKDAAYNAQRQNIVSQYNEERKGLSEHENVKKKETELEEYKKTDEYKAAAREQKLTLDAAVGMQLASVQNVTAKRMLAKLAADATSAELSSAETQLDGSLQASDAGRGFMERIASAEVGQEAAKAFLDKIKNAHIGDEFKKAGEAIAKHVGDLAKVSNIKDPKARGQEMKRLRQAFEQESNKNTYARAIREKQFSEREQNVYGINRAEADAAAAAIYVELEDAGAATPSSAFVDLSKRLTDVFNKLDEASRADFATKNLASMVYKRKQGKELTTSEQAYSFGMLNNLVQQANADDQLFDAAAKFNQLIDNPEVFTAEEKDKYNALREFMVDTIGAISLKDGRYVANKSDARANGLIQNYILSGGNDALLADHIEVGKIKDADKTGMSYKQAVAERYKQKYNAEGTSDKDGLSETEYIERGVRKFISELEKSQTLLNEGAASFKEYALNAGHTQLGAHQFYDQEMGVFRMSTEGESKSMMISSMRKRKGMERANYHSLGTLNASSGILEKVDADVFAAIFNSMKTSYEASRMVDRTRDGLMAYEPSEAATFNKDSGAGQFGGSVERIAEKFGSATNMIRDVLIPELIGAPGAFALIAEKKFGGVDKNDAAKGAINLEIDGTGINATTVSGLIEQVKGNLTNIYSTEGKSEEEARQIEKERRRIEKALSKSVVAAQELEKGIKKGKDKKTKDSTPDEVAEGETAEEQG